MTRGDGGDVGRERRHPGGLVGVGERRREAQGAIAVVPEAPDRGGPPRPAAKGEERAKTAYFPHAPQRRTPLARVLRTNSSLETQTGRMLANPLPKVQQIRMYIHQ